ncbi:MAG: energy-coupled thiamine transporter ThiT [Oscillospiraceae bacterium]|jgi:thiamine transporter
MNQMKTKSKTRILTECAMMVALASVLTQVKLFQMPQGGSVTLCSMLPVILVSFRNGPKWGVMTGLVLSAIQMITGWYAPPAGTVLAYVGMILLDYVLAFSLLGTAAAYAKPFRNRYAGIAVGTVVVCAIRFLCSFFSGFLIWGSLAPSGKGAVAYSFGYQASYMVPETILTVSAALALYRFAPQLFGEPKNTETEKVKPQNV